MQTSPAIPPLSPQTFKTFSEFYPFYLTEHSNLTCHRLHFVDSTLVCLAMLDSAAVKKAALKMINVFSRSTLATPPSALGPGT